MLLRQTGIQLARTLANRFSCMSKKKQRKQNTSEPSHFPDSIREGDNPGVASRPREQLVRQEFSFSGPVPPPHILEHYEKISPGAARTIIAMAESQSEHRKYLEKTLMDSQTSDSRWGLFLGFFIALALIGSGTWLTVAGHTFLGGMLLVGTPTTIVGIFVSETRGGVKQKS